MLHELGLTRKDIRRSQKTEESARVRLTADDSDQDRTVEHGLLREPGLFVVKRFDGHLGPCQARAIATQEPAPKLDTIAVARLRLRPVLPKRVEHDLADRPAGLARQLTRELAASALRI